MKETGEEVRLCVREKGRERKRQNEKNAEAFHRDQQNNPSTKSALLCTLADAGIDIVENV